jgi:hypothetical protein
MKTTTTFTSKFLRRFEDLIFITQFNNDWQKEWEILTDHKGNEFTDLEEAIKFIRKETDNDWGIGLSTFGQVKMENAEWDNL